ncbi:MAG: ferritin-like domain-containing protein [Ilumatobacteraceae bacterium]
MIDSAVADHAAIERTTRRALFGAGVVSALALVGSRPAGASSGLSDADLATAAFAISLELSARDLYDAAIAAGADARVWMVMREQHEAYASRLSGITGISAQGRNAAVYDSLEAEFATSDPATAGFNLENAAAATHTELVGMVEDRDIVAAMASFVSMESRHATVLATLAGQAADFDAMFVNAATALSPEA